MSRPRLAVRVAAHVAIIAFAAAVLYPLLLVCK
jgi:hypothetical protein